MKFYIKSIIAVALFAISIGGAVHAVENTLWGYYTSQGESLPSVEERGVIAAENGIFNYTGTAEQNEMLLEALIDPPAVGLKQPEPEEGLLGISVVTGYQRTLRTSMNTTQSFIPVSSLLLKDETTLNDSMIDGEVYVVVNPGKTGSEEITRCTSVSSTITAFTGCTRGLAFSGTSVSSVAANRKSHNAGSTVVISNVHYTFRNLIDGQTTTEQSVAGKLLFSTYPEFVASTTIPTQDGEFATKYYVDNVGAGGLTSLNVSSSRGLEAFGTVPETIGVKASSTVGYTFDANGSLYRPVSSTTGIEADVSGLKLNTTTITELISTTTPTANKIVRAGGDGKIDSGWVNLSFAFGDGNDGTVDINSGSFSSGPITNNALTRDAYFDNLTLSGGDLNTAGYKLYVKGTLTIDSTYKIHRNGNDGGNGGNGATGASGGAAGSAGAAASALSGGTLPGAVAGIAGTAGGSGTQSAGNNSSGANNGTAVSVSVGSTGVAGVAGGAGGDATNGSGGSAGSVGAAGSRTAASTQPRNIFDANRLVQVTGDTTFSRLLGTTGTGGSTGGGGGGGWTSGSDTGGGGGGAGGSGSAGGFVAVYASTIVNNGSIEALGGNGGDGGDGGDGEQPGSSPGVTGGGGGGASGSGGSGGVIVIVYDSLSGSGSIDVSGGSPGTPGTFGNGYNVSGIVPSANGSAGSTGNTGGDGVIYQIEI